MKVCIAGGGRVGMYLAQSLLSHRHKVTIIEPQEALCRTLADTLDIPVICGDSLSFDTLRTADVASCDAFVAVTNTDETNLVACQIAKREFGVNRTVARASNPKNRDILHTLGVDTVVCGTDNLSHILEREIETDTIRQLLSLGGGTASLNEILLPEDFQFAGKEIKEIPIPGDAILVSITRDTEFIIPHGSTVLLPGDLLVLVCAICFSVHILVIDHFTATCDGVKLSCLQFLFAGTWSTILALFFDTISFQVLLDCIWPLLYVGVFSCGVGYTLQILAQKGSNPTVVTILLSLESVFAVIAGAVVLHQQMTAREYLGCVLMFAAVVLAQIPMPQKKEAKAE